MGLSSSSPVPGSDPEPGLSILACQDADPAVAGLTGVDRLPVGVTCVNRSTSPP